MSQPIIQMRNVSLRFKRRRAAPFEVIKNLDLDIEAGETLAIIGRNGAGKSTLLQLIADIIRPDGGSIERNSNRVTLLALNAGLQPNLNGRDNAIMSGLLLGLTWREITSKLDDIRQFSELEDFFERPVATYSSGMRARLGFATACHVEPDVLLLDEVLAVGDQAFRKKALARLRAMLKDPQRTVVLVSHNLGIIREVCSRAAWIENGELVGLGPVEQVVDQYLAVA